MIERQLYLKELNEFFLESDNWQMALHTLEAVNEICPYWRAEFWGRVLSAVRSNVDVHDWNIYLRDKGIEMYPIIVGKTIKTCCISVSYDDTSNGYYGIWFNKSISMHSKSNNKKLFVEITNNYLPEINKSFYYKPDVQPHLYEMLNDNIELFNLVKSGFIKADEFGEKISKFINDSGIHRIFTEMKL